MLRTIAWVTGMLLLAGVLAGCASATVLRFTNRTECGAAAISLTNTATGNIREYTVTPGASLSIEVDPGVEYRYIVEYERLVSGVSCDAKRVTAQLSKGQTLNVSLESISDPALETPAPAG